MLPFQEIKPLDDLLARLLQDCAEHQSFDHSSQVAEGGGLVWSLSHTCLSRGLSQVYSTIWTGGSKARLTLQNPVGSD